MSVAIRDQLAAFLDQRPRVLYPVERPHHRLQQQQSMAVSSDVELARLVILRAALIARIPR